MSPERDWTVTGILAGVIFGIGYWAKSLVEGRIDRMAAADEAQSKSNEKLAELIGTHTEVLKTMTESVLKSNELDRENRARHDSTMILIHVLARKHGISEADINAEEDRQRQRYERHTRRRHHPPKETGTS